MHSKNWIFLLVLGCSAVAHADDLALPLSVGSDGRTLVDAQGAPVLLNGDTAWSMIVGWTREETIRYLDNRRGKGFNAIIVNLIERYYGGDANPYGAPTNRYGHGPFLTPGDFSAPNSNYFDHAEWVVSNAAARGLLLFLTPAYLGYTSSSEGWYQELLSNGTANCLTYGQYVGQRFSKYSNIVWMAGGDRNPDDARDEMEAMIAGIRQYDAQSLWTAHNQVETFSREAYPTSDWLSIENVYTYNETWPWLINAFTGTPTRPFFFVEGHYEYEPGGSLGPPGWYTTSERQQRSQAYWTMLHGGMGHFMGNFPIWYAGNGWSNAMEAALSRSMVWWRRLFLSRQWNTLLPDINHDLLTAGYGSNWNYIAAAMTSNRQTAIVYVPNADSFTLDLTQMSGSQVRAWWYDPRTGASTNLGLFATTGSVVFTPPATNDWVFVADDAALNLPPPGVFSNEFILIDFGHTNALTPAPDANGNYWNNIATDSASIPMSVPVVLRDAAGRTTSVSLLVYNFGAGANTNGTLAPSYTLGPLAVSSATRDSFFVPTGSTAAITITGLNANASYQLECFASRDTPDTRVTRFTAEGLNTNSATLQTSGSGIGAPPRTNANAAAVAVLSGLQPTLSSTLVLRVTVEAGSFGYIGAMRILRTGAAAPPSTNLPPTASSVALFGAPRVGTVFTSFYVYADAESDPEGISRYQWQRAAATNASPIDIPGATNATFLTSASETGQYVRFAVTPIAAAGAMTGSTVYSAWRGPIGPSNALAVFHIGNSFTRWGDIPAQLASFAAASNRPHVFGDQLADGQGLGYHWTNGLPGGLLSRGAPSRSELATLSWDALVLQPMSREWQPTNLPAFQANAAQFDALADSVGARLYLYVYWPWRDDPLSDQDDINAAFEQVRIALSSNGPPVRIIPVGEAFRAAVNEMGSGELVGLTRNDLYRDALHPSDLGCYLSALVHFAVLHRRSPIGLPATGIDSSEFGDGPVSIPTNVAAAFQRIAWDVARSTPHTGITQGRYEEWFAASGMPGDGAPESIPFADELPNLVRWAHGLGHTPFADADRLPIIQPAPSSGIEIRYTIGADAADAGLAFTHEWTQDFLNWSASSPTGLTTAVTGGVRVLSFPGAESPLGFRYKLELRP